MPTGDNAHGVPVVYREPGDTEDKLGFQSNDGKVWPKLGVNNVISFVASNHIVVRCMAGLQLAQFVCSFGCLIHSGNYGFCI